MKNILTLSIIFALSLSLVFACDSQEADAESNNETSTDEVENTDNAVQEEDDGEDTEADVEDVADGHPGLLDPSQAEEEAPAEFSVLFETTSGDFVVDVDREWAPNGADRLYNLIKIGYFDDAAFFRVVPGFMVQFGLHSDPKVTAAWRGTEIADDEATHSNTRGKVTFATRGPNTRTTQLFINFGDNRSLDAQGFTPLGEVSGDGMDVVDSIYSGYGERPNQGRIQQQGNEYLRDQFENLDYIVKATIVEE